MSTETLQEDLITACKNGDIDAVRRLIEDGAHVNAQTEYGTSAIASAARQGHVETVLLLCEMGAKPESALWEAAKSTQASVIEMLLERGINVNAVDDFGFSALRSAIPSNSVKSLKERHAVIRLLLEAGADPNLADNDSVTPLMSAVYYSMDDSDDSDLIRLLLQYGANLQGQQGANALTYAAMGGQLSYAQMLIETGAAVNEVDHWGETAWNLAKREGKQEIADYLEQAGAKEPDDVVTDLFSAILWNHPESVKIYLDDGADVNAADRAGDTPLICAIRNWANLAIIRMLLEHGADPDGRNEQCDESALDAATIDGLADVVRLLIEYGATVTQAGEWPLLNAIRTGSVETVQLLLEARADANTVDSHVGASSLMVAILDPHIAAVSRITAPQRNSTEIARLLLEHGADVAYKVREGDIYGHEGMDALIYAAYCGTWELIPLLLDSGAEINSRDGLGQTALWHAVTGRSLETAEMLIQRGADVNQRGDDAESPLMIAARQEDVNIVRLLIQHGADVNASIDRRHGTPRSNPLTALSFATWKDNKEIIRILTEAVAG